MKEFLKKIFYKQELKIEELTYLAKLLDTNLSINYCFSLLKNRRNEKIFSQIEDDLKKGILIEDGIKKFLPDSISEYMVPMLKKVSFNEALNLALEFNEKHNSSKNRLLTSIAYPCILLFVTITALYLFDLYGIDAIFNLIGTFESDIKLFETIRIILKVLINTFYYGLLILSILLVVFIQPKRISLLYLFLSKYFPNSLVITYYSEEFVSLLLICVQRGYKTKQAMQILMSMKSKPIISFLAFHLDESLLQGETMKKATQSNYFDSSLSRFIKIANFTNDFINVLRSYTNLARKRIEDKMKKYTLTIQLSTYFFIGTIVVFIYEILFLPMQAIANI